MHHSNRRVSLKILLPLMLVFLFLQGAGFSQPEPPPNSSVRPADIIILVDRSKSLDFVYDDVIDSVRFTLSYLETFDPDGRNFRVSIIPFAGNVKIKPEFRRLQSEFMRDFNREFGTGSQDNSDFSRAFCEAKKIIDAQRVNGYERQILVFLFSDGDSYPFGDTLANDQLISECVDEKLYGPEDIKKPLIDIELAETIFKEIKDDAVSLQSQPVFFYTVALHTAERIDNDAKTDWWENISDNYMPYCRVENSNGNCIRSEDKVKLIDFLNSVFATQLLDMQASPFIKAEIESVEIQPNKYTSEMQVSVLNRQGVRLFDSSNRLLNPIQNDTEFLIYRIPISGYGNNGKWILQIPLNTFYKIDYLDPKVTFTQLPDYVWTDDTFEIRINVNGENRERKFPEEIFVSLLDNTGEPIEQSDSTLTRQGKNNWNGVLRIGENLPKGVYRVVFNDPEIDSLVSVNEKEPLVTLLLSPRIDGLATAYDSTAHRWTIRVPIINKENLPSNPILTGMYSLVGGKDAFVRPVQVGINDGELIIVLEEKENLLAGAYQFSIELMPGLLNGVISTPDINYSFSANLYVVPTIEDVVVDENQRSVELILSNFYQYKGLHVELLGMSGDERETGDLECALEQFGNAKCYGKIDFDIRDITSEYKFDRVVLIGQLASGDEIPLAEKETSGQLKSLPPLLVLRPVLIFCSAIIIIFFLFLFMYWSFYNKKLRPNLVAQTTTDGLRSVHSVASTDVKNKLFYRILFSGVRTDENLVLNRKKEIIIRTLLPRTRIPILGYSTIGKKTENLIEWIILQLNNNQNVQDEDFKAVESVIDEETSFAHRDRLKDGYKGAFRRALGDTSLPLDNTFKVLNRTPSFRINSRSDFLEHRVRKINEFIDGFDNNGFVVHDDRRDDLRRLLNIYRFVLGAENETINVEDIRRTSGMDYLVGDYFDDLNGNIVEACRLGARVHYVKVDHEKNKLIIDFELPRRILLPVRQDIGVVIPSMYYLRLEPDKTYPNGQFFCIRDFELAAGLQVYEWDSNPVQGTPLEGFVFRLIVDNPEKVHKITLGSIVSGSSESTVLEIPHNGMELDSNDPQWFERNLMQSVWGNGIIYNAGIPANIGKEKIKADKYQENFQLLFECGIIDKLFDPSDPDLNQDVIRLSGWYLIQENATWQTDELALFRTMCRNVLDDLSRDTLNEFEDIRDINSYSLRNSSISAYKCIRSFSGPINNLPLFSVLNNKSYEDNFFILKTLHTILQKI